MHALTNKNIYLKILKAFWKGETLRPFNDPKQKIFTRRQVQQREKIVVAFTILLTSFIFLYVVGAIVSYYKLPI